MLFSYCTNIHPGESWGEVRQALETHVPAVRAALRRASSDPLPLGLRLGHQAASELLADRAVLRRFRGWMESENLLAYTVNGFPYGAFHGTRVKENVYLPDWSDPRRAAYTLDLFRLLGELVPEGEEASVSTLPGSFKRFVEREPGREPAIRLGLRRIAEEIDALSEGLGLDLHLGLEPEPGGYIENSREVVGFFDRLLEGLSAEEEARLLRRIGICYDTCHFAIAHEDAATALDRIHGTGIRLSKVHLSNALSLSPRDAEAVAALRAFDEPVYLHQVGAKLDDGGVRTYQDLPDALEAHAAGEGADEKEWRVHFHIPVLDQPVAPLGHTLDHLEGAARWLARHPETCRHFEVETYTFGVLPENLRSLPLAEMLAAEMRWCETRFFTLVGSGGR